MKCVSLHAMYDVYGSCTCGLDTINFILPKQDSTHLVITVIDANDNIPIFLDNEYYGTVREELPSGSTVTVVSV